MRRIGIDLGGIKMEIIFIIGNLMEVLECHRVLNLLLFLTFFIVNFLFKSVRTCLAMLVGGMGLLRLYSSML